MLNHIKRTIFIFWNWMMGYTPTTQKVTAHRIKMNWTKAATLRTLYLNGMKQKDLAVMYGISQQAVSDIVTGKTWA